MEFSQAMQVTLYGLVAGVVGTGLGGVLAYLMPRPRPSAFSGILGFAAGVMLAVVFFGLLDQALQQGGRLVCILALLAGMAGFLFLDRALPHQHMAKSKNRGEAAQLHKGMLLALGISLHNLPEGLAIGAGFAASAGMGLTLVLVLGLHNIPEGLIVAMPLKSAGRELQGVGASFAAGIPMGLGALIGGKVGNLSPLFLAIALSFAAGGMLYIVCDELIPDAYKAGAGPAPIYGFGLGIALGLVLTAG